LVGPITNWAGNEQRIELPGLNEKNYEEIAGAYIEKQKGVWFSTEKLGFFCVAMRREVPEKIGYLDERFGIGMFEDDDYCVRAKKAGYRLAVVEDCFVYHKGSISFKKLSTSAYMEIFNRNRSYFHEKHGVLWAYTDIASALWSKLSDDLAQLEKRTDNVDMARIKARIDGMTNCLYQLREVEQRNAQIGGEAYVEVQLAEKQRQLMEISDWATSLKQENERLADWAAGMNREMEEMSRSRLYRVFRYLQRRGL
jgi:GT2 family glycosyltransferase